MSRVCHFEIPVDDPDRATKFYQQAFGWKVQKWDGPMDYWMVSTGASNPGIDGAFTRRGQVSTTTNTVGVESVDASLAAITGAGGKALIPKTPIPGVGYFAYCMDTEGNMFGIMQPDTSAK